MRKGYVGETPDTLFVGARDKETDYEGPVARITYDDTWLWIVTDDYEGSAMINIEALPALRRALTMVARFRKAHPAKRRA